MTGNDPVKGIALTVGAMLIFSLSDAVAKTLSQSLPVLEIAWLRYVVFAALLAPVVIRQGRGGMRSRRPGLQAVRGFCLLSSSLLFVLAVAYLPLADATATGFVAPLVTTALSIPLLGERVGVRRWAAVAIGLLGVLIVVRPGTSAFNSASVFPILSAIAWSLGLVITRKLSGSDGITTMLVYSAGTGLLALNLAVPFVWRTPNPMEIALGVLIGVSSTAGQWLMVRAFREADASLLVPYSYTQLLWSGALGYVLFDAVPDAMTFVGAAIIVFSGLYTVHRERIVSRARSARSLAPGK